MRETPARAWSAVVCGLLLTSSAVAQCDNAPITLADAANHTGQPVLIDPLSNDHDPDGEAISLTFLSDDCDGSVTQNLDVLRLVSDPPRPEGCTLTYRATDESGLSTNGTVTLIRTELPIFSDGFESAGVSSWSSSCSGSSCGPGVPNLTKTAGSARMRSVTR